MLDSLCRAGGDDVLDRLDAWSLPDEPFTWEPVAADMHEQVAKVLALVDRCSGEMLDVEYGTACRRFLARAAAGDPEIFRRRSRAETTAAAICWVIGKTNDLFTQVRPPASSSGVPSLVATGGIISVVGVIVFAGWWFFLRQS